MRDELTTLFNQLISDAVQWAPRLIVMIVLLVVGLVVAWTVGRLLGAALTRLNLDQVLARAGVDQMLLRIGVQAPVSGVVSRIVFYLILFLFVRAGADVLGLEAISDAIAGGMAYVPNLLAAIVILMVGAAIAQFAGRAVRGIARDSGVQFAGAMGSATSGFIFFVLAMMAIAQLRIDTQMVQLAAGAVLGGIALGFGLALGLGSREVMRSILAGFYARQLLRIGTELEIGGAKGTLVSITPTQLLLETETDYLTVPNAVLLEQRGRQPK